jgi:hypothetical protein
LTFTAGIECLSQPEGLGKKSSEKKSSQADESPGKKSRLLLVSEFILSFLLRTVYRPVQLYFLPAGKKAAKYLPFFSCHERDFDKTVNQFFLDKKRFSRERIFAKMKEKFSVAG